jgi:hypothetical protein
MGTLKKKLNYHCIREGNNSNCLIYSCSFLFFAALQSQEQKKLSLDIKHKRPKETNVLLYGK